MENKTDLNIRQLIEKLDVAVLNGNVEEADKITSVLYRIQGGTEETAVIPARFIERLNDETVNAQKENQMKSKSFKKILYIAATAAVVMAVSVTAIATNIFGVHDLVIRDNAPASVSVPVSAGADDGITPGMMPEETADHDLIVLQGYPDSPEYKATEEWRIFCNHYDEDGSIIAKVGNSSNKYTERYPMYLVYSKDMADKLEEIIGKYGLTLHQSMTVADNAVALIDAAGTGDFLSGSAAGAGQVGGYVYNDGTFHYDGQLALQNGKMIAYQFGNYVKGTFSDVYLNVGDADSYREWRYTTASGIEVSLALGETKALVIVNLENSFVTINVLTGTAGSDFGSSAVTKDDLEAFADLFDFSVIK